VRTLTPRAIYVGERNPLRRATPSPRPVGVQGGPRVLAVVEHHFEQNQWLSGGFGPGLAGCEAAGKITGRRTDFHLVRYV